MPDTVVPDFPVTGEPRMRAYRLTDRQAGAGLTDLPRPSPGPGEALVRIAGLQLQLPIC